MGHGSREQPARLAEKLSKVRAALGISQDEMRRRLGMKEGLRHYISGFETGEREPTLIVLLAYANIAGVYIDVLVDDRLDLPTELGSGGEQKHHGVRVRRSSESRRKDG